MVQEGKSLAVVSDAGTPGICDPGAELAEALVKNNVPLHPIPGPSAVVTALSICGFQASEFTFLGNLNRNPNPNLNRNTYLNPNTNLNPDPNPNGPFNMRLSSLRVQFLRY
jgi:16S rRNA C1402 (ribose-2'-O) methylase RsmI